jgi:3alpha(or 20beta)-hydroxysteroid dehydrogenase
MAGRLEGKVAIVTGGTRGMGEAEVRGLAAEGAKVVFGGRDEQAGHRIASEIGDSVLYVHQDVGVEDDWRRITSAALERFGAITSLVNNAGMQSISPVAAMQVEELDRLYRTNQLGPLLGLKHVVGPMRTAGAGSVVNIGSPAGVKGLVNIAGYAGTKAAMSGITKSAAVELAPDRIRVNLVIPGFFDTKVLSDATGGKGAELGARFTPLGRTAQPSEIVGTIIYLLSDDSLFVTGTEIRVDGGYTV